MTSFSRSIAVLLPSGRSVPEPLVRAWDFMESQEGWGGVGADGTPYLCAYAGQRQLGPVFTAELTLLGWVAPDAPGTERLVPIAEADGAGGMLLIWIDDAGEEHFVALDSEGGPAIRLADDPIDFLRVLAIGYDELTGHGLDEVPYTEPGRDTIAAHAEFRAWVEKEFSVTVPEHWEYREDEELTTWLMEMGEQYGYD